MKIINIPVSATKENDAILDENFWNSLNILINCTSQEKTKSYLRKKALWFEKPLFDYEVSGVQTTT